MAVVVEQSLQEVGETRWPRRAAKQGIGLAGLAITLWLWAIITRGAYRIDRLITEYEQTYGSLELSTGSVSHNAPAIKQLCDELVAAADYFYPFAWMLFLAAATGWGVFSTLAFRHQVRVLIASWGLAVVVLAVQLFLFADAVYEMTIITE